MAEEQQVTEEAEGGAEAAEEEESTQEGGGVEFEGEFDAERAKRAIENARAEEKRLKAKLAEKEEALSKYEEIEKEAAEAEKSAEQKLAERDSEIRSLKDKIALIEQKHDFITKAAQRGYSDPALAFVAAKEQGLLGTYDPKTGNVDEHDFEKLEESHPTLAAEAGRRGEGATGDAGARGRTRTDDVGTQFNEAITQALRRR